MLLKQIPSFFKSRREALMKAHPGAVFIFPSCDEILRNPDVSFPFRQESNFFYLSGFEEPESFFILAPAKSSSGASRMILFVRHRDLDKEMWEGERYGVEGALQVFGADEAYTIDQLGSKLPELIQGADKVYYRLGVHETRDRQVFAALETARRSQGRSGKSLAPLHDPNELIGEMRLYKSPEEMQIIRKACQITALAHKTAMKEVRPGMKEYEVEALIDYVFRKNGCQRVGYGSIVAGGVNAACLHYRANNDTLRDNELLLIDAGGEFDYYTSDITRTFPVGRSFTPGQGRLYDLVLKAQKECIALAKPGVRLTDIHQRAVEVLTHGMLSLGLLKGKAEELIKSGGYKRFYPHNTGHWLGVDVHDVGLYSQNSEPRKLEPGMVFTIEPGFYVQPNDAQVPAEYHNIGIRIEDDILITATGCEVLTGQVPKDRAEIEALKI
ncbi:aminopeptidase P N-terminal domain-containing protein [Bdellovibrionota bacterium FG-1]